MVTVHVAVAVLVCIICMLFGAVLAASSLFDLLTKVKNEVERANREVDMSQGLINKQARLIQDQAKLIRDLRKELVRNA